MVGRSNMPPVRRMPLLSAFAASRLSCFWASYIVLIVPPRLLRDRDAVRESGSRIVVVSAPPSSVQTKAPPSNAP